MSQPIRLTPKTTAEMIRKVLRGAFPGVKFSVKTGRGAGVSSVDVSWTDGPTTRQVEQFIEPFQMGRFDGMTDSFEYNQGADRYLVIDGVVYDRGVRYTFTRRTISAAVAAEALAKVVEFWGGIDNPPQVVPTPWGGYDIAGGRGNERIRPDLNTDWYQAVRQAAEGAAMYQPEF